MQKKLLFITAIILLISFSQSKPDRNLGNLLRCFAQIGDTIKDVATLVATIQAKKDASAILKSIGDVSGQIRPLMQECSNPICLTDAKKRCEESTGKSCEQYGAIMYPKCEEGFYNVGCCLCESSCPPGFRDDGLFCAKPEAYGRGAGYPWKFGDSLNLNDASKRCQSENSQGCEQNGLVIYPKCRQGFHNVGCCLCSPDCPSGTTDIGVSCTKPVYGRGVGFPMQYDDCQNQSSQNSYEKSQNKDSSEYLSLNTEQLKDKILEQSQKFMQNKGNKDLSVKFATELSKLMAALEVKSSKK
ncbi:hypothetical protein TTHERM_00648840 (macronuclear) [Tetrahymena thermophila SB210]|uniref:Transmembrane protein n=1 Tax=Tetrahymena thermophila (strain SB210) TaxID=312017 RepID=I7MCQ2_TETTS|nr:hypothetical protein TTHERM_00648840 [Tetrahymena thermophila SB210]EAR84615.1 hypothetical protein TTHERM_00648840 [Tetrahymena thermophila SB210]|eukprot:XP_001032278.1 hypothetical protein TTHERM_00648840 [Tetrahymena thermophila SB210]